MSSSLLIIVGCECAPGLLVCITPVQLAAKLQSGLIVSMRFRSDRSCPLSRVVAKTLKACWYIHQLCRWVLLGLGGNNLLLVLLSRLFLLSIWNNQTVSFDVASFLQRHCLLFFLKKQHLAPGYI